MVREVMGQVTVEPGLLLLKSDAIKDSDLESVMAKLEVCSDANGGSCDKCPYMEDCIKAFDRLINSGKLKTGDNNDKPGDSNHTR